MPYKEEDITLTDLETSGWVSARAINICRNNQLNNVSDIIEFYRKNGSFKTLENCGDKTEKELSEICKRFSNHSLDTIIERIKDFDRIKRLVSEFDDGELEEINRHIEYLIFKLSVRARNGLQSLFKQTPKMNELVETIYQSSFSFSTIRNIGEKSVIELNDFKEALLIFIRRFKFKEDEHSIEISTKPLRITDLDEIFTGIVNNFNPFKKAALNRHIEYLISNLGVRARNGITDFFGHTFNSKEIIEMIYSYSFDFNDIKNIGSKSVSELNSFKDDISAFIKTLQIIEDAKLNREYAKLIIKTTFSNLPINFNEKFENIFDTSGKIKLFKLLLFLIENGHLFKQKEKELFYFLYTQNNSKSFEQIAKTLDLTKERLRQIKVSLENEIQNYFRFIHSFNSQEVIDHNIVSENYFKVIDNSFIQKINDSENVNFNVRFYTIIFGLFLEKSHSVLGDDETISGKGNYSNTIRYKSCYIIDNLIFSSFDFEKFAEDVGIKLSERIVDTYALHFEGFLFQFIKLNGKQYLSTIKTICEAILYNEFGLVINSEGYIVFERNVKKLMQDYVLEILEDLGQMTKVEHISKAINEKYPELETTEQSVRGTLQREKDLFIYIGRTSTYGLRKWQSEKEDLRGGTIRNLTEEFLQKFTEPKHISDISSYVLKFRPNTYERSVLDNLKADKSGKFIFMGKGFVGLKAFNYSSKFFGLQRVIKDWNENYQELKEFRKHNSTIFPSVLSPEKSERSLYNFLYKNRVAYYKNELDSDKIELLKEVGLFKYLESARATNWYAELDKLKTFVATEDKLPSANSIHKEERGLYRFLYQTKKKIINNELENDKIRFFNEIINYIKE